MQSFMVLPPVLEFRDIHEPESSISVSFCRVKIVYIRLHGVKSEFLGHDLELLIGSIIV